MEKFQVNIVCKPYVRRFIELNYGSPAELSKDRDLYAYFRSKLHKKTFKNDKRYSSTLQKYSAEIAIKINRDDFYRYGWDLSATDMIAFNLMLERKTKDFLYNKVGIQIAFGSSLSESISSFQKKYGFTEDVWAKESIYKDCQRNLGINKVEIREYLSKMMGKL